MQHWKFNLPVPASATSQEPNNAAGDTVCWEMCPVLPANIHPQPKKKDIKKKRKTPITCYAWQINNTMHDNQAMLDNVIILRKKASRHRGKERLSVSYSRLLSIGNRMFFLLLCPILRANQSCQLLRPAQLRSKCTYWLTIK